MAENKIINYSLYSFNLYFLFTDQVMHNFPNNNITKKVEKENDAKNR